MMPTVNLIIETLGETTLYLLHPPRRFRIVTRDGHSGAELAAVERNIVAVRFLSGISSGQGGDVLKENPCHGTLETTLTAAGSCPGSARRRGFTFHIRRGASIECR